MIWRDDDVSCLTDLDTFKKFHDLFIEHEEVHTIALIARDIETHPELVRYILDNKISVQLHCWEHIDLTLNHERLVDHIYFGVTTINNVFGVQPATLFPPWNKTDDCVNMVAKLFDLNVSDKKLSTSQFIRFNGKFNNDEVVNFHYWAPNDYEQMKLVLKIYKNSFK